MWKGKLEDLTAHIDVKKNDCQYVDVKCPKNCSHPVPRCAVEHHLEHSCPKRDYSCDHCGHTATYEEINNEHYLTCSLYPIPCPNSCRMETITQGMLQEHLQSCPYQQIQCKVLGCSGKFLREDSEMHMQTNAIKHVEMMSTAMKQAVADFTTKLDGQESQFKERERELVEQLEKCEKENTALKQELEKSKSDTQKQVEKLQNVVADFSEKFQRYVNVFSLQTRLLAGDSPHHFTIYNFTQRKEGDETWHSPPMYFLCHGPKFGVSLRANGSLGTNARCTHVSIILWSLAGELDDSVNWPVRCSVTVELQNQHRNQDHHQFRRGFQWERPKGRKIAGAFGKPPNDHQFISHAALEWNPKKQTQYLKDNTLHLVVDQIEPHSQIFLHAYEEKTST